MRRHLVAGFTSLLAALSATGAAASDPSRPLPIVDTHLHYSRNSWDQYTPEAVLALLDRAGVGRAFVSSTPDDGTLSLHALAPHRIVPVLRPYRQAGELGSWHRDPTVTGYLRERLGRGIYRGIGEFHLDGEAARSPVVAEVAELARREGLFLHCHCDAAAVEILLGLAPGLRVLWAHAGMSAGPDVVRRLVERHPGLWVELALRSDVAPAGRLDPEWQALFLGHPGRFMVGTDTWVPSRWADLPGVQEATRGWLGQLPAEVARRIASENAEALARGGR